MAFAAVVPALISGATSLIGAKQTTDANNKAARLAQIQAAIAQQRREAGLVDQKQVLQDAQGGQIASIDWGGEQGQEALLAAANDAAGYINAGSGAAIDAYGKGEADSTAELRRIQNSNAPGMAYLRQVIADPGSLTPYQQKALEDQRRTTGNTIRSSSIAGSGRTAAALMKDVDTNYVLKAQEANRQQALQAAGLMASTDNAAANRVATNKTDLGNKVGATYDAAGRLMATTATDTGAKLANVYADTAAKRSGVLGSTASQISSAIGSTTGANATTDEKTGTTQANAATANGKVAGESIGAVGSAIADMFRQSKYGSSTSTSGSAAP